MDSIYKIKQTGKSGQAYVMYTNGLLRVLYYDFDEAIEAYIPYKESNLVNIKSLVVVELLEGRSIADKIAVFCAFHKKYKGFGYRVKEVERANIKQVSVSKSLLKLYFNYTDFPLSQAKSISDYIKHYNYVRDLLYNGKSMKAKFPDVYDREFERSLEGETLSAYWRHLHKLGWKKADGIWQQQQTID